jgi:thiol-disulfide isomerase/thioredoxin
MATRISVVGVLAGVVGLALTLGAQAPVARGPEETIRVEVGTLRSLADDARAKAMADLAQRIRALPAGTGRLTLAMSLANLSTEGDFGRDTLQAVTTTLVAAVRENPETGPEAGKAGVRACEELAQLARYEGMTVALDTPTYRGALKAVDALDALRARADFTLKDLTGRAWTRTALSGQVVLVNFWATWCPPCRKEMPDLDALAREFAPRGLVVLAISDEAEPTVRGFLAQHPVGYPILLDPGRTVSDALKIESIPKTFIYDRTGRLAAQSIDMRTRQQFLGLLARAGLE